MHTNLSAISTNSVRPFHFPYLEIKTYAWSQKITKSVKCYSGNTNLILLLLLVAFLLAPASILLNPTFWHSRVSLLYWCLVYLQLIKSNQQKVWNWENIEVTTDVIVRNEIEGVILTVTHGRYHGSSSKSSYH